MTTVQLNNRSKESISLMEAEAAKPKKIGLSAIIGGVSCFVSACTKIDQKAIASAVRTAEDITKSHWMALLAVAAVCLLVEGKS